jgi:superfamily II DNA or RNA helicase
MGIMYLGNLGLTIPKTLLTLAQQQSLKKDLTFSPKVSGGYGDSTKFYAYRESTSKLYCPRFYNNHEYSIKLSEGIPIDLPFHGSIRPDQQAAVDAFMKNKCGLLELPCGFGKTILALHLIHLLKRKTLVIVHKEFLLEQWVERIREFLPTATIGRIQGEVMDTDKDIVIGMLQSLSMKTYPVEMFRTFGFTIIDETHHIAAEVFSNALFKIVTPAMLGLSATMERKDGLTKVFKLFLGEIVYTASREKTQVFIHKVTFTTPDVEFNEVITNFKGDMSYSTMINKVSEFVPRIECILRVLVHLRTDPTTKQVMILAHTKYLLNYLYGEIVKRNIGTVGYYVGGMKNEKLKESETKEIILATFSMAQEALDIKTLSTLILATPKTDVTQAVGRILRVRHEKPVVVDIVDPHATFVNQWKKRREYYTSQGYTILESRHDTYPQMTEYVKRQSRCLLSL